MINALLFLLPQEAWICLLVLAGFFMMFGFRKVAVGLVGTVVLLAIFSPFIDALIESLPMWILVMMMLLFVISLFRFIIGRRVADHVMAHLLYDVIVMPFRFIGWLFRRRDRRI
jgi:hypothetical protein